MKSNAIVCLFCCMLFYNTSESQILDPVKQSNNPIIPDMLADPSIIKIANTYYCYATTDGYNNGLSTSGPPVVWKSRDLVNWSFNGIYFPSAAKQLYWAPSAAKKVKRKFYIYPTINGNLYVAKSSRADGPFKLANNEDSFNLPNSAKPIVKLDGPKGTKGIDGEVFIDDDGAAYLFWAEHGAGKLKPNMLSVDSASIIVIPTKREGYSEGPIMFKRQSIYYYLYTLSGHEDYHYAYGYSTESPLGPFTFPEVDIIAKTDSIKRIYGPGHGSVFVDNKTGQYYLSYLEFGNGGANRQVWIDKLGFNADGTIKPIALTHAGVSDLSALKKGKNLAVGKKISGSSMLGDLIVNPVVNSNLSRVEKYSFENAIDQSNGTRWMADTTTDKHPYVVLDLEKTTVIRQTEAYFVSPTAGHAYQIEYSNDGVYWKPYGGHSNVIIESPHVSKRRVKARFLKLTILKGIPGLWEFKAY